MRKGGNQTTLTEKTSSCVTYSISTDNGDLPVLFPIISWLSDFQKDGRLGIFGIGLLIFQPLSVMLGPASTCIFILNPLKDMGNIQLTYIRIYTHSLTFMHICLHAKVNLIAVRHHMHVTQSKTHMEREREREREREHVFKL